MKADLIYLDACVFIAHFQQETTHGPDVAQAIEDLTMKLDHNRLSVATSTVTRVEVLPNRLSPKKADQFARWLLRSNVEEIAIDHRIIDRARQARADLYSLPMPIRLKTPDAIHLATAMVYGLPTLYTLDKELLKLKGHHYVGRLIVTEPIPPPQRKLQLVPGSRTREASTRRRPRN